MPRVEEDPPGYILEREGSRFGIGFRDADFTWDEVTALGSQIDTWNMHYEPPLETVPLEMIKAILRVKGVFPGSRIVDLSKPGQLSEFDLQVTE